MSIPTVAYCMNLDHRTDRWESTVAEFNGTKINLIRVPAIKHNIGKLGVRATFTSIIRAAKDRGDQSVLIIEDDLQVLSWEKVGVALDNAPSDFDILVGGTYLYAPAEIHNDYWIRIKDLCGLHFIIINSSAYDAILNLTGTSHIDIQIGGLVRNNKLRAYCMKPMLCIQKPGYSDIRNTNVNDDSLIKKYI